MNSTIKVNTNGNETNLIIDRRRAFKVTATFPTTDLDQMLRAWIVKLSNLGYAVQVQDYHTGMAH